MKVCETGNHGEVGNVGPHRLKMLAGSGIPRHWLFLDTETEIDSREGRIEYQRFRLGWTCSLRLSGGQESPQETWKYHRTCKTMLDSIEAATAPKSPLHVIASNPGFDLWVLKFWTGFAKRGWTLDFLYDRNLVFILSCRKDDSRLKVLAIQNLLPFGVKQLGAKLGLPKLNVDPLKAPLKEVKKYCRRDVEILRDSLLYWIGFIKDHDCGPFRLTAGSQALAAFRRRRLSGRVWIHKEPEILSLERDAYFGGRTEIFYKGKKPKGKYVLLDVNSLYPYVMLNYRFPINFERVIQTPTIPQALGYIHRFCVVAEVELDVKHPFYAFRHKGKTIFPTGEIRTFVCTLGLRMAAARGEIKRVLKLAIYKRGPLFKDYVSYFYPLKVKAKEEKDKVTETLVKRYLNTLYGKFGQMIPEDLERREVEDPAFYRELRVDAATGHRMEFIQCLRVQLLRGGLLEGGESMPAVCAHVTEYGRFYLALMMVHVGWENVLYCDTDSIIVNAKHLPKMKPWLDELEIGMLSVKQKATTLEIHGAKDYRFGRTRKIKGVGSKGKKVSENVYKTLQFPSTATLFGGHTSQDRDPEETDGFGRAEVENLQREGLFPVTTVVKTLRRIYDKGVVGPDGQVTPIHFGPEADLFGTVTAG